MLFINKYKSSKLALRFDFFEVKFYFRSFTSNQIDVQIKMDQICSRIYETMNGITLLDIAALIVTILIGKVALKALRFVLNLTLSVIWMIGLLLLIGMVRPIVFFISILLFYIFRRQYFPKLNQN